MGELSEVRDCRIRRNPKWWIQDGYHLTLVTSVLRPDAIKARCRPQGKHCWTYSLSSKSYCHNFIIFYTSKIMDGGGGGGADFLGLRRQQKALSR